MLFLCFQLDQGPAVEAGASEDNKAGKTGTKHFQVWGLQALWNTAEGLTLPHSGPCQQERLRDGGNGHATWGWLGRDFQQTTWAPLLGCLYFPS